MIHCAQFHERIPTVLDARGTQAPLFYLYALLDWRQTIALLRGSEATASKDNAEADSNYGREFLN